MIFLIDHNLEGHALILLGNIANQGWLELIPIRTIGSLDRLLDERDYRNRCVDRLLEILLDIENYMGVGRLFIP